MDSSTLRSTVGKCGTIGKWTVVLSGTLSANVEHYRQMYSSIVWNTVDKWTAVLSGTLSATEQQCLEHCRQICNTDGKCAVRNTVGKWTTVMFGTLSANVEHCQQMDNSVVWNTVGKWTEVLSGTLSANVEQTLYGNGQQCWLEQYWQMNSCLEHCQQWTVLLSTWADFLSWSLANTGETVASRKTYEILFTSGGLIHWKAL